MIRSIVHRHLLVLVGIGSMTAVVLVAASSASWAQTADGLTPAEETACDGLPKAEFGLCNAYCEAIDCDTRETPLKACESLRDNYFERTGFTVFPCDVRCPELPDPFCSDNGVIGTGGDSCDVCLCDEHWSGPDCATCDSGFDSCGVCGGYDDTCGS
jgi:hypothetical protein